MCPSPTAHPLPQTTLLHISAKRVSRKNPRNWGREGGRSIRGVGCLSFAPLHFPIFRGRPTASFIGPRGKVPRHESRPRVGGLQPHQKTFRLRNLTERVAATTGIILLDDAGSQNFPILFRYAASDHLAREGAVKRAIAAKYLDIPYPRFFFLTPAGCNLGGVLSVWGWAVGLPLYSTYSSRDDSVVRPPRSATGA